MTKAPKTTETWVEYADSLIEQQSLISLMSAAGMFIGIVDGKLTNGRFRLVTDNDKDAT